MPTAKALTFIYKMWYNIGRGDENGDCQNKGADGKDNRP
jgi:hypothetical protein